MQGNRSTRTAWVRGLLATFAVAALPGIGRAAEIVRPNPSPQDLHVLATSGGLENPEVIFAFNPQPDPPGDHSLLDLSNPEAPSLLLPAVDEAVELVVGFPYGSFTFSNVPLGPTVTDRGAVFQFDATAGDGSEYQVELTLGGYEGDWASFNPQPDPPGDIGASFTGDPQATLSIFQIEGSTDAPLSFSAVPEPATLGLLGLGSLALTAARRRRRTT